MQDAEEPKEYWRDDPAFVEWVESLGKPIPDKLDGMALAMVGAMWLAWNAAPTRKLEEVALPEGWEWWKPKAPDKDDDEVCVLSATSKQGYTVEVWNDGEDFLSADGASFEAVEAIIARRRRDLAEGRT